MNSRLETLSQAHQRVRATRDEPAARDVALLVARIGLAWGFIYPRAHTLFGAFGTGGGIHEQALYFAHVAHLQPATFFAVLGGIIECFGGAAVGLGIFGRLAALALVGDMIVAMATVTFANGIVSSASGLRLRTSVALAALAAVIAALGTGRLSLDVALAHLLRRERRDPDR